MEYTTVQGDTWDTIAKKVYGKEECADLLMAGNWRLLEIFVFSEGAQINIPERKKENIELPPWRKTT